MRSRYPPRLSVRTQENCGLGLEVLPIAKLGQGMAGLLTVGRTVYKMWLGSVWSLRGP